MNDQLENILYSLGVAHVLDAMNNSMWFQLHGLFVCLIFKKSSV